jgi:alpha-beta hydrolase superfamily lysophospholipase/ubiquinone/menaquinone biosynthesis C-methylase UbiE
MEGKPRMRSSLEFSFKSWDGTELAARMWPSQIEAASTEPKAIVLLHRGHEHAGRLQSLVDGLELPDFAGFAYDARGHGKSPGARGYANDFMDLVRDLEAFVRFIEREHGIKPENIAVVANSVGAVVCSAWVHDYAPQIRCQVLAAPAFEVKLYVPLAMQGLRIMNTVKRPLFISSYVKSRMLTHDRDEAKKYDEDPLIAKSIAMNILVGLRDHALRVVGDAEAISTPTLLLSAGRDFVVELKPQQEFFKKLSTPHKRMRVFPNFFHGVMYEKERALAFAEARSFINERFSQPVIPLCENITKGADFSWKEYARLLRPSKFGLFYAAQKKLMKTFGAVSDGMKTGLNSGFDSGLSLDYIYRNQAKGAGPLGRIIDRAYLDAVGWRGIRERRKALVSQLCTKITELRARGEEVRILDIAGGPGDYILEALERAGAEGVQAVIRDYKKENVERGRQLAASKYLDCVTYEQCDAFAAASYENTNYQPNLVVVSGLFELIPDNTLLLRALQGIKKMATVDAMIIYTGQPWHPQVEMIARTLVNREGQPWIMRRRPQSELDAIFASIGVKKSAMAIDSAGIFTVSTGSLDSSLAPLAAGANITATRKMTDKTTERSAPHARGNKRRSENEANT